MDLRNDMDLNADTNPFKKQKTGDAKEQKRESGRIVDARGMKHIAVQLRSDIPMKLIYIGAEMPGLQTTEDEMQKRIEILLKLAVEKSGDNSVAAYLRAKFRVSDIAGILSGFIKPPGPEGGSDEWDAFRRIHNNMEITEAGERQGVAQVLQLMRQFDKDYLQAKDTKKVDGFIMPGPLSNTSYSADRFAVKIVVQEPLVPADFFRYILTPNKRAAARDTWAAFRDNTIQDFDIVFPLGCIQNYMDSDEAQQLSEGERKQLCDKNIAFLDAMEEEANKLDPRSNYAKEKLLDSFNLCFPQPDPMNLVETFRRCLERKPPADIDLESVHHIDDLGSAGSDENLFPYAMARLVQHRPYWSARSWMYNDHNKRHNDWFEKQHRNDVLREYGKAWPDAALWSLMERHPAVRLYRLEQTGYDPFEGMVPVTNRLVNPDSEKAYLNMLNARVKQAKAQGRELQSKDVAQVRNPKAALNRNLVKNIFSFTARYQNNPMMHAYVACKYLS